MIALLSRVRDVLERADIEGLIAIGAPKDEYDSEAEMISHQIADFESSAKGRITEESVVTILRSVWQETFELDDQALAKRRRAFNSAARAIVGH